MPSMANRTLKSVRVIDIEKRRLPSKHYVYLIEIKWSDGSLCTVGRRFSAFFMMHMTLLEKFPLEGGQKDPSRRILPFLPGKILFKRSHTRDVTLKRLGSISEYCESLLLLPEHISQCDTILRFFETSSSDIARDTKEKTQSTAVSQIIQDITGPIELETYIAIADYKAEAKTQISLHSGETVEVVEKSESGWWLVCNTYGSNGWVPGAYLEKEDGSEEDLVTEKAAVGQGTWYVATSHYDATSNDEISFPMGAALEVLQINLEGWWLARYNSNEGWVPGSYLEKSRRTYSWATDTAPTESVPGAAESVKKSTLALVKPPPKRATIRRTLKVTRGQDSIKEKHDEDNLYITLFDFDSSIEDGLSFKAGQIVKVIEQSDNGWWLATLNGAEGWVPSSYLESKTTEAEPARNTNPGFSAKMVLPKIEETGAGRSYDPGQAKQKLIGSPLKLKLEGKERNTPFQLQANKQVRPVSPVFPRKADALTGKTGQEDLWRKLQDIKRRSNSDENPELKSIFRDRYPTPKKSQSPWRSSSPSMMESYLEMKSVDVKPTELEEWFKDVTRQQAEAALLAENKEGSFVVRKSRAGGAKNPYSFTLLHNQTIFNFHIRKRVSDGRFATGLYTEGEKSFASVKEMVDFYKYNTLVVGDETNRVRLSAPPFSL
nr:neutrophil cytosolic factor 1 isoform X1 [Ciona intestinalis]|eukprot:XP_018668254.1 neutrophil cytosolic factor 1 isoform X1 [Ciona intestinalis]